MLEHQNDEVDRSPLDDLDDSEKRWLVVGICLHTIISPTHMAHFTAFDDSCDSSALLGIIVNIDKFPAVVQSDSTKPLPLISLLPAVNIQVPRPVAAVVELGTLTAQKAENPKKRKATADDVYGLQVLYLKGEMEKQTKEMKIRLSNRVARINETRQREYSTNIFSTLMN
ncbi:unnamed protein product [Mytilus edulis]|uniref:Uncharacterized protein n=1 Tax=Mytilus edulis TaxID=6550 RepID=A0A8S3UG19_MYTED|nr:unnamed protein product [Mytilus edulis]